jgi:PAS domain S-box-containing protein
LRLDGFRCWVLGAIPIGDELACLGLRLDDIRQQSGGFAFRDLAVERVEDYATFMLDPEGRVVSWNMGAERTKGYQPEEILGQPHRRFYPQQSIDQRLPERLLEAARTKGRSEDEGWRLRKDGSRFWANVIITALRCSASSTSKPANPLRTPSRR